MAFGTYVDSESEYDTDDSNAPRVVTDAVDVLAQTKDKGKTFKCYRKACSGLTFKTFALLRAHKAADKDLHDYCKTCDEDFDTFHQLQMHLLNSDKHFVCFVCCKEFKSEGGRDLHMKQSHKQRFESKCPGCSEMFATQSGLLQHVEGNLCPGGLRRSDLHKTIMEAQDAMSNLKFGEAAKSTPVKSPPVKSSPVNSPPGINAGGNSGSPSVAGTILGMPRVKVVDHRDRPIEVQDNHVELKDDWFNEETRMWICPFRGCKKRFPQLLSFEQHINSPTHQAKNFRCPGCMDLFASSSALLQHCEAAQCRLGAKGNEERLQQVLLELGSGLYGA